MNSLLSFNTIGLLQTLGYTGLFAVVFAESGILIGLFLPGDSLLFNAGLLASQGYLDITTTMIITIAAAIIGDSVGYAFGRRIGPHLFQRDDSRFFPKRHLAQAQQFYRKHGGKTILLARFTPIVRTFAPVLAGVGSMHYPTFLSYNIIGGILWGTSITLMGYYLGKLVPNIDHYLLPIIVLIIILSALPGIIPIIKKWISTRRHP